MNTPFPRFSCIAALAILVLSLAPRCGGQVVIDTTFGPGKAISTPAPDRIAGVLPSGWQDNTSWARVWVDYQPGEEEARPYTRVATSKVEEGWTQLQHPLPRIDGETYVRLELTARSLDDRSLQIGIRDLGPPYQWHWDVQTPLKGDWRSFRHEFRLGKIDTPIGLYLASHGSGTFDLGAIKLTFFSRDELIAEMKSQAERSDCKNLLRLSRFPLGMQMGWSLTRDCSDGDEVVLEPDRDVPGPTGFPSLHVRGRKRTEFYTAPFAVANAFRDHFAAVSLKGSDSVTIRVICDGRTIASHTVSLTDQWQRATFQFRPRLLADWYTLRFETPGPCDFHLDAMQVAPIDEATGQPTAFAPQMPCEVAIQVPVSDASAARIQFHDEPARLDYCVTTTESTKGARLRAKVFNAYGESRDLPSASIEGKLVDGCFDNFMADFDRPFGPHRVEAWVEDNAGNRISPFNEMLVYRLPRPKYWGKDAPHSAFGVHTNSTTRHCIMLKAIGVNWTRLHDAGLDYIGWYHLEPEKGKWQFHDEPIQRYRKHHVMILGELGTAPPWASYHPGYDVSGYFDRFYQPRNLDDYASYVRTVAQRYKGVIHAWDVWNEPWITAWWGIGYDKTQGSGREGYVRSPTARKDFAALMKTAYTNVKAIDPDAIVLGINTTTGGGGSSFSGDEWTKGIVDAGGLKTLDAIAYHHYAGQLNLMPDDEVAKGYWRAVGYVAEKTKGPMPAPVWMTEGQNARIMALPDMYHHTLPKPPTDSDPFTAGDRQVRFLASLRVQGVAKAFLYTMHGHSYFDGGGTWRAITTGEGFLHCQGAAIAALAQQIEEHHFTQQVKLAEGVWAYRFEADDGSRQVAILAPEPQHAEYRLPAGALDLFGNPVPEGTPIGKTVCYLPGPGHPAAP